ncbi:MAG: ATP-binding cassette domain-containing protein [Thermomicrobiales bacterium]
MAQVSETTTVDANPQSAIRNPQSVFEVRDVVYEYTPGVAALNGVSLAIPRGRRVAILGANGSGKSTLIRVLDGLYFPSKGSVAFCGGR